MKALLVFTGSVKRGFQGEDGIKMRKAADEKTNKLTQNS